jgi:hypothetical protein
MKISKHINVEVINESDYERCILCENLTDIRKDKDINERLFYIEGLGQLCEICYKELYEKDKRSFKKGKKN